MKKILTLTSLTVCLISYGQTSLPDTDPNTLTDGTITISNAPGASGGWTYNFGTKLTVWGASHRNFEIMNTSKSVKSTLAFRTYDPAVPGWTDWREFLFKDSNGFVGIGTTSPQARLHVDGNSIFTDNITLTNTKYIYMG